MKIICNCHNTSVMLLNKTGNNILRDILHILYQGNLHFLNIKTCEGIVAKIMSCMSTPIFMIIAHAQHITFRPYIPNFNQQDNKCAEVHTGSHIQPQVKYGFQCADLHKNSESLNIVLLTSPVPNITHIRQKIPVNCHVHPKVQYDFHCTNIHKILLAKWYHIEISYTEFHSNC